MRTRLFAYLLVAALGLTSMAAAQDTVAAADADNPTAGLTVKERYELLGDLCATKDAQGKDILSSSYRGSFLRYLGQSERQYDGEDLRNALQSLNNTSSYASRAKVLMDEVAKLEKALRTELTTTLSAKVAEADAFLDELALLCMKASKESELDKPLDRLEELQGFFNRYSTSEYPTTRRVRERVGRARNFMNYWVPMVAAEAEGRYVEALQKLNSVSSSSSYRFLKHSDVLKRQKRVTAAMNEGMEAEISALKEKLQKVTSGDAVADVASEVAVLYQRVSRSGSSNPYYQKLQYAQQAVQYWVNVISAEEDGDFQQALNNLRQLESSSHYRNTALLSSSDVRKKKAALTEKVMSGDGVRENPLVAKIDARIEAAKSTKDLIGVASSIQGMTSSGVSLPSAVQQQVHQLNSDLQQLMREKQMVDARRFGPLFQSSVSSSGAAHPWAHVVQKFRMELWTEALAALCDVSEGEVKKAGENVDTWLLRLVDAAVDAEKWPRAHAVLDGYRIAFYSNAQPPGWLSADMLGIKQFVVGSNLEAAGELKSAVAAYRQVIVQVGERVPVKAASARLKALRASNPELFGKALRVPAMGNPRSELYVHTPRQFGGVDDADVPL